ncbi:hypothetical protein DFJ73DRAFT_947984 [Zopfochytrium polystomum]|nr:hypothetical protein DFJ73DRAFT_947984 [Zopfochytrium polystomum]
MSSAADPGHRSCEHAALVLDSAPQLVAVADSKPSSRGYVQASLRVRIAATRSTGRMPPGRGQGGKGLGATAPPQSVSPFEIINPSTFPAPLALPNDDLNLDPAYPPQSLLSWIRSRDRNEVSQDRRTIYVADYPAVDEDVAFVTDWATPAATRAPGGTATSSIVPPPDVALVVEYLTAFYHGLAVKLLPTPLSFVAWSKRPRSTKKSQAADPPTRIGLRVGASPTVVGVSARACPDAAFPRQLDLNHILDAALDVLPTDAYAVLLMDLDDDYCCGRAFGGSRVAVVSAARYAPAVAGKDPPHAWPASHCKAFVADAVAAAAAGAAAPSPPSRPAAESPRDEPGSALSAAVHAAAATDDTGTASGVWLARVARTAAHELGHCLAMDHCVYHACAMQGSASLNEDLRQPPYLCPVCLAKLARAVAGPPPSPVDYLVRRYAALRRVCGRWAADAGMFAAFDAWLGVRMAEMSGLAGSR